MVAGGEGAVAGGGGGIGDRGIEGFGETELWDRIYKDVNYRLSAAMDTSGRAGFEPGVKIPSVLGFQ